MQKTSGLYIWPKPLYLLCTQINERVVPLTTASLNKRRKPKDFVDPYKKQIKMRLKQYLMKEEIPSWIKGYKKGDKFDLNKFFSSKILYYAGAGEDGSPISIFNKTHAIHSYIYVDYLLSREERKKQLSSPEAFRGYRLLDLKDLKPSEMNASSWTRHYRMSQEEVRLVVGFAKAAEDPFALLAIYEREEGYDESHGAKRFALLYIGGDAFATCDALFINPHRSPYVFFLRDHGFGGNWAEHPGFGRGGLLFNLVEKHGGYPHYIMTDQHWNVWEGYTRAKEVESEGPLILYRAKTTDELCDELCTY